MSKGTWNKHEPIFTDYMDKEMFYDKEKNLVHECIIATCKEYKQAYKSKNKSKCIMLEKWFRSDQFLLWTNGMINPDKVIEELKEQAIKGIKTGIHKRITPESRKEKKNEHRRN